MLNAPDDISPLRTSVQATVHGPGARHLRAIAVSGAHDPQRGQNGAPAEEGLRSKLVQRHLPREFARPGSPSVHDAAGEARPLAAASGLRSSSGASGESETMSNAITGSRLAMRALPAGETSQGTIHLKDRSQLVGGR